jgi:hypothetical protein
VSLAASKKSSISFSHLVFRASYCTPISRRTYASSVSERVALSSSANAISIDGPDAGTGSECAGVVLESVESTGVNFGPEGVIGLLSLGNGTLDSVCPSPGGRRLVGPGERAKGRLGFASVVGRPGLAMIVSTTVSETGLVFAFALAIPKTGRGAGDRAGGPNTGRIELV